MEPRRGVGLLDAIEPGSRRPWLLGALFSAILVSRILWIAALPMDWRANSQGDELFYHDAALGLVEHGELAWHGSRAWQPPVYPALLALSMRWFGDDAFVVQLVQNALLVALGFLLAAFVTARLGSRAGLLALALVLVNPTWAHAPQTMMSETLFAFELVVGVLLLARALSSKRVLDLIATGLVFGIAALTREIGILYAFAVAAILFHEMRGAIGSARALRSAGLVLLVAVAVIAPWTIRNARLYEAFVPVTVNAAFNAYIGNHDGATGGYEWALPESARAAWDARASDPRHEIEAIQACRRETIDWVAAHPWTAGWLALKKLWILWGPTPVVDSALGFRGLFQRVRWAFWPPFAACVIFGLWRLRRDFFARLLLGFVILTSLVHMATLAMTRYRWPLEILFAYPAVVGLFAIAQRWRSKSHEASAP